MQEITPNLDEGNMIDRELDAPQSPNIISETHPDILGLTEAMFEDEISTIDNGSCNSPINSITPIINSIVNAEEGHQHSHFPQLKDVRITDVHLLNESLYNKVLATKLISNRLWILDYIIIKIGNLSNYYKLENVTNVLQRELLDPDLVTITDRHQFMQYKPCRAVKLPKEVEWLTINPGNEEEILSIMIMI